MNKQEIEQKLTADKETLGCLGGIFLNLLTWTGILLIAVTLWTNKFTLFLLLSHLVLMLPLIALMVIGKGQKEKREKELEELEREEE